MIDPDSGELSGSAGSTTGWGLAVQCDPSQWVSFVGFNETNSLAAGGLIGFRSRRH